MPDLRYQDLNEQQKERVQGFQDAVGTGRFGRRVREWIGGNRNDFGRDPSTGLYSRVKDQRTGEVEYSIDGRRPATGEELDALGDSLSAEQRRQINETVNQADSMGRPFVRPSPDSRRDQPTETQPREQIPPDERPAPATGEEGSPESQQVGFLSNGEAFVNVEGRRVTYADTDTLTARERAQIAEILGIENNRMAIAEALRNARRPE